MRSRICGTVLLLVGAALNTRADSVVTFNEIMYHPATNEAAPGASRQTVATHPGHAGSPPKAAEGRAEEAGVPEAVSALSGKLGADRFVERESATRRLIEIGKESIAARNVVRSAMNRCVRSRDPEVSERAKRVLRAVFPPPKPPPGVHAVTGAS